MYCMHFWGKKCKLRLFERGFYLSDLVMQALHCVDGTESDSIVAPLVFLHGLSYSS